MPTCRVCKRDYVYDDEQGYDRELCSPMCDGIEMGRRQGREYQSVTVKLAAFCARLHGADEDIPRSIKDEAIRLAHEFKAIDRKQRMEIPATAEFATPTDADKQMAIEWGQSEGGQRIIAEARTMEFYLSLLLKIREVAKAAGYAIGVHGSLVRDFDLIAVPWVENALDDEQLARGIAAITNGMIKPAFSLGDPRNKNPGEKPHGRIAWTILLGEGADAKFIDLSVMPRDSR